MESLGEELGEEKEGWPLVESVAFMVDETAAAASERVFLEDRYLEVGFAEACCCGYSAYSGACGTACQQLSELMGTECGVAEAYQRQ